MTRTISDEEKAILERGGLCLADLLDYHCRLPEWADSGVFGDEFCRGGECGCSYLDIGCHSSALTSPGLVAEFAEWVKQREWDMAHPQVVEVGA